MSSWVTAIVLNSPRMRLRRRLRHIHLPLDEPVGEVPPFPSQIDSQTAESSKKMSIELPS